MPARAQAPAFLFDLDGTLVDSVYQHVLAWQEALERCDIQLAVWRIHRRIGISGGLLVNALLRETGRPVSPETARPLQRWHAEAYQRQIGHVRPLPGASWDLLATRRARALGLGLLSGGYGQDYGACQTPRTVDRERRLARFSQLNLDMCIWHKSAHVYETCVHLLTDTSSIRRHDCRLHDCSLKDPSPPGAESHHHISGSAEVKTWPHMEL